MSTKIITSSVLSASQVTNMHRIYSIKDNLARINHHLSHTLSLDADCDYVNGVLSCVELFINHLNELTTNENETTESIKEID